MANKKGVGGFKRGKSGNPTGRPKVNAEIVALAQEQTEAAINTLASVMLNEENSPGARVAAAIALLDRGHGKPTQAVELGGPDGEALNITINLGFRGPDDRG